MKLKNTILIVVITTFLISIFSYLYDILFASTPSKSSDNIPSSSFSFFLFSFLIIFISFGLPNLIFLLLIYYLNIGKQLVLKMKYLVIEIFLLFIIYTGIDNIHPLLIKKVFPETSFEKINFYFDFKFELLYSFILIFVLLLIIKAIVKQDNVSTNSNPST